MREPTQTRYQNQQCRLSNLRESASVFFGRVTPLLVCLKKRNAAPARESRYQISFGAALIGLSIHAELSAYPAGNTIHSLMRAKANFPCGLENSLPRLPPVVRIGHHGGQTPLGTPTSSRKTNASWPPYWRPISFQTKRLRPIVPRSDRHRRPRAALANGVASRPARQTAVHVALLAPLRHADRL
jgi:hypothetical protein